MVPHELVDGLDIVAKVIYYFIGAIYVHYTGVDKWLGLVARNTSHLYYG
jgi:hypothetical protein